jgi:DNA-binding NtrC family response regulator
LAYYLSHRPRRIIALTSTLTAPQFQAQPLISGLTLVDSEPPQPALQVVGVSAAWRKLLMQAEMAAPHIQVATIEGEHGCGKQTLARYLFSRSTLAQTSFQTRDAREWLVSEADPSTLGGFTYLDRVDLLAPPGQGLLLRVLKAIQDRPIGRAVLLASSQSSLRQMAGQGLLMPDLAYRLTAVRLAIPPLRERREDIAPLAQCLLDRICARYQQRPVVLGPGALARLLQHNWPGNVRELASVLETALLEAENGIIHAADLALSPNPSDASGLQSPGGPGPDFGTWKSRAASGPGSAFGPWEPSPHQAESLNLDSVVRRHVQSVLDLNRGNKLRAARQLGISRSTLYRILGNEAALAH